MHTLEEIPIRQGICLQEVSWQLLAMVVRFSFGSHQQEALQLLVQIQAQLTLAGSSQCHSGECPVNTGIASAARRLRIIAQAWTLGLPVDLTDSLVD